MPLSEQTTYNPKRSFPICSPVQLEETIPIVIYTHSEEVEKAHESGLSYGKYKAFLELQKLDPTITVEEIQSMTMREIRERISQLSGNVDDNGENSRKNTGTGRENHSGNGSRHRGAKGRNTQ